MYVNKKLVLIIFTLILICTSCYYIIYHDFSKYKINNVEQKGLEDYTEQRWNNDTELEQQFLEINKNIIFNNDEILFEIVMITSGLNTINISRSDTKGGLWYRFSEINSNNPVGYDQFAHYNDEVLYWNVSTNELNEEWYRIYSFQGLYIKERIDNKWYYNPL